MWPAEFHAQTAVEAAVALHGQLAAKGVTAANIARVTIRTHEAAIRIIDKQGPLANPAGVKRHLLGVYDKALLVPVAETLAALGGEAAWVVHGADGMDELTTTGPTDIAILENGRVREERVTPEEFGLKRAAIADLKGGDAAYNAQAIAALFEGARGAFRDIVMLNTAAALVVAGKVLDVRSGLIMANEAIETGRARDRLGAYIRATRAP